MSMAMLEHTGPWGEEDYFALGETANRIALIDGSLWIRPEPSKRRQRIAFLLAAGLAEAAEQLGLLVLRCVNLRLAGGRIVQPDLVVADTGDTGLVVEAAEAMLVVDVVSPGDAGLDRLYAAAGIGWYLRVEQPDDSVELHLERLVDDHYLPAAVAGPGQPLTSAEPFPFALDIASALRRRP
jgi:Putative restriction endonuclease